MVKKIAFFFIMFGWILLCVVIGVVLLPFLLVGYLIRGNYILLKEGIHNSKWGYLFLWLLLLPLSVIFITVLIFIIDSKRRSNRWIFRIFLTAELSHWRVIFKILFMNKYWMYYWFQSSKAGLGLGVPSKKSMVLLINSFQFLLLWVLKCNPILFRVAFKSSIRPSM